MTDILTGTSAWEMFYNDIALFTAEGTVYPIYNRGPRGHSMAS